uniref:E2F/DP family winged-helix DNA-binding domain-containing protein n=1 Tax=Panagrolaimus sp. JU765 TaxID=591449 RepID=A0AC34Q6X7_9BILA
MFVVVPKMLSNELKPDLMKIKRLPLKTKHRKLLKEKEMVVVQGKTLDSKDDIGRQDSSLLRLTKMFLEQNMCDDNGIVNLNDAADRLNVQKRRLYDITNVLEGINMIEKVGKNSIRWKQMDGDENRYEKRELLTQVQELRNQENHLDSLLQNVTNALQLMKEDATEQPYFYLKFNELKNIPCFKENTIIAVKAPKDSISVIEVSDPQETGKFEIAIRNQNSEPLNAFYLSNDNEGNPVEMGQEHAKQVEFVDVKIPISQMNSFNDSSSASPLLSSSNQRSDDPLLPGIYHQTSFYDEWDSGYQQPSSSGLHHSTYPNFTHLASPLKSVFDNNHHNNDLTDLSSINHGYISLEPAPDPAPYMYGMSENEIFPSNLYDNQDW